MVSLPTCLIGMEACSGPPHWARLFTIYDQGVRLMAPKFVPPCRLSGKRGENDAADAASICEAEFEFDNRAGKFVQVRRPSLRDLELAVLILAMLI